MRISLYFTICSLVMSVPAVVLYAQQPTASEISGTAHNQYGATVPNLTVNLQGIANNTDMTKVTDASGNYHFAAIPPGRYRISTVRPNGTSAPSTEFQVAANNAYTIDLTVSTAPRAGDPPPDAVVTAEPELLSKTDSQTAIDYNTNYSREMPQPNFTPPLGVGHGTDNLTILSAGVTAGGIGQGVGPADSGVRPVYNEFRIDGTDNNSRTQAGPLTYVSNAATEEQAVFQNQFAPVFGHSAGAKLDKVLRTGSNQVHGQIYDYLQHGGFNAMDQSLANLGATGNPRYDQNRLGGQLGIPIIHNKLFFLGNFEYIPLGFHQPIGGVSYAPTPEGFAILSNMPGVSAENLQLLGQSLPETGSATRFTTVAGQSIPLGMVSNQFQRSFQNQYVGTGNLDWVLGTNDSLHGWYTANDVSGNFSGSFLPAFNSSRSMISQVATLSEDHIFAPTVTNELRLGYNRSDLRFPDLIGNGSNFGTSLSPFPNVEIAGESNLFLGPGSIAAQRSAINGYQLNDNVSVNHRSHNITFGFDGLRILGSMHGLSQFAGNYIYSDMARFLLDLPPDVLSTKSFGDSYFNNSQYLISGWVQDRWIVRPNFSLNLGVRYSFDSIPGSFQTQNLNAISNVPGVLNFDNPQAQTHNFAPNVGFAWSPASKFMSRSVVVRGGFGMSYAGLWGTSNGLLAGTVAPQLATTVQGNLQSNTPGFLLGGGLTAPAPIASEADARALTSSFIGPQRVPYTEQWNFGVETDLWHNATFGAKYMGTRGVHLPVYTQLNAISAVTAQQSLPVYYQAPSQAQLNALPLSLEMLQSIPTNPFAQSGFNSPITTIADEGNSWYHGLGLTLNQRLYHGVQMIGAYTWSHLIDDSTGTFLDLASAERTRANSLYDRRHRFTLSGLWDTSTMFRTAFGNGRMVRNVLGGWMLSGTFTVQSGQQLGALGASNAGLLNNGLAGSALYNPSGTPGIASGLSPLMNSGGATVGYLVNKPNARFIQSAPGVFAPSMRNTVTLGHIDNFDVSLSKSFNVLEQYRFSLRADAFNLFNHPQFIGSRVGTASYGSLSLMPGFLNAGSPDFNNFEDYLGSNPRVLQLGLRLTF